MNGTVRVARIAGIDIGLHYTWLIAFALITWSLAVGFFPQQVGGLATATYWIMGAVSALMLFGSVLLHELAHSLVARSRGLRVHDITLLIFGGVSNLQSEPKSAGDEFVISIVGPASSAAIAAVSWAVWLATGTALGPLGSVLFYLAVVNAMLAGFNLLPGFPLDGGRVFRAIIWGVTGSLERATNIAAGAGHLLAFLFIGYGVLQMFTGDLFGGLWIIFLGWFLNGAAESSRASARSRAGFAGVRVADLADPDPETVSPTAPVDQVVRECLLRRGRRAMPVLDDGRLVGIVSLSDIKGLSPEQWPEAAVADIMTRPPLYSVNPDDELDTALRMMAERDLNQLLVLEGGRLVGLLPRSNIIRYLQLRQELKITDPRVIKDHLRPGLHSSG
ncbi:MAG: CBS domain-containing protein [Chloroflexota bacterium]